MEQKASMKSETKLKKQQKASAHQLGNDGFVQLMKKAGIPVTKENYLDLVYFGDVPDDIPAEDMAEFPQQFQAKA